MGQGFSCERARGSPRTISAPWKLSMYISELVPTPPLASRTRVLRLSRSRLVWLVPEHRGNCASRIVLLQIQLFLFRILRFRLLVLLTLGRFFMMFRSRWRTELMSLRLQARLVYPMFG